MTPRRNILLLNFAHYGHIIPLLELGKKLSQHHDVDFLVSSVRVPEIAFRGLLPADTLTTGSLNVIGLADGLTLEMCNEIGDGAEVSFVQRIEIIVNAYRQFLPSHTPAVVIADHFLYGAAEITHSHGIPFYFFHTASTKSALEVLDFNGPTGREFEDAMYPSMKAATVYTVGIIVNSTRELDLEAARKLQSNPLLRGKDLKLVGPVFSATEKPNEEADFRAWLDSQAQQSVVYVSFGSLVCPSANQLHEIGLALLSLGRPFIFSLPEAHRRHLPRELHDGADGRRDGADRRRDGADRRRDGADGRRDGAAGDRKNFLIPGWAPQRLILGHPSVAVFVSHCGWNSTTEAMFGGVPVVGWPVFGDQFDNSEWFREHGIGETVQGTGWPCEKVLLAAEIADKIRKVADCRDYSSGGSYKENALKWNRILRDAIGPTGSASNDLAELSAFPSAAVPCVAVPSAAVPEGNLT
ncbi:hypothetical protein BV898_01560 [Hypsibius exemplaris]|uniref:UDP-glucuronosyltransferase n=1 Tax=Hypsibius exemplaris TaxID=2072580 RepID=A0A1W0XAT2_HYPEX|nr:hypothetical protein BV898_01560 [Hypsibius exemplaris]